MNYAAILIASAIAGQGGKVTIPDSYVLNHQPNAFARALSEIRDVSLTRPIGRAILAADRLDRESAPNLIVLSDSFDNGEANIITSQFGSRPGIGPNKGVLYFLGAGSKCESRVLALPMSAAIRAPQLRIRAQRDWRPGLVCIPIGDGRLTKGALGEKSTGELRTARACIAALGDMIISAATEFEMHQACSLVVRWNILDWRETGHFGEGGAWLMKRWADPIASATTKLDPRLQVQVLGMCSLLSKERFAEERFKLLVKLAEQGRWPRFLDGGRLISDSNRLVRAANRFPNQRAFFFYAVGGAPDDAGVALVVNWVGKAKSGFARTILNKLAYWAQRPDLEVRTAEQYVDGEPVLLNRDELLRIWRTNPPAIKVRG